MFATARQSPARRSNTEERYMTRLLIAAILASMISCAHHGKPDYCNRMFDFKDQAFDLDGSGTVTVADFVIYQKKCGD